MASLDFRDLPTSDAPEVPSCFGSPSGETLPGRLFWADSSSRLVTMRGFATADFAVLPPLLRLKDVLGPLALAEGLDFADC